MSSEYNRLVELHT